VTFPDQPTLLVCYADVAGQDMISWTTVVGTSLAGASYSQVTGSTSADYYVVGTSFAQTGSPGVSAGSVMQIQIGVGASGSEVAMAKASVGCSSGGGANLLLGGLALLPVPLRVSAGKRIAIKVANSLLSGSQAFSGDLLVVPVSSIDGN
jgi:hypothetical protein